MALALNQVHKIDCVSALNGWEEGTVDLVFADPPFNIGYDYDVYRDKKARGEYLDWSKQWIEGVYKALKPDGTFWLAIGDEYAAELKVASQDAGFICRSWVIWYYTFGVHCTRKFTRSHAHIFHFVKDEKKFTFNDMAIRVPSARQLVYADDRANPAGRLPDDTWILRPDLMATPAEEVESADSSASQEKVTWILRPQDAAGSFRPSEDMWYFPRVNGTFKERAGYHGCQMPEQLLGRIIKVSSNEGELVMDPFGGSASTLVVAKKLGRQCVGFDISDDYVERGNGRLAQIRVGDPLEGAPEPLVSAPKTADGRRLDKPRKKKATPAGQKELWKAP